LIVKGVCKLKDARVGTIVDVVCQEVRPVRLMLDSKWRYVGNLCERVEGYLAGAVEPG
jgi:hypothetical protein